MRLHLVSPTHYLPDGSLHKTTRYWTSGITLPYLKRLTPPEHEVTTVDELFYDVDLESEADVVADLAAGRSRGIYRASEWHSLRELPRIDYRELPLLKWEAFQKSWFYRMYFHWPIVFSRGCPHPCEYCAVQTFYRRSFRTRPVDEVIADVETIKSLGGDRLLFLDDNPVARPEA